jgi:hypothetical protein
VTIHRPIYSVVRAGVYAAAVALLAAGQQSRNPTVSGFVCGAILADYATWIIICLFEFPKNIRASSFDAVVNVVSALIMFHFLGIRIPREEDRWIIAFLAFIFLACTKAIFYLVEYFLVEDDEDE